MCGGNERMRLHGGRSVNGLGLSRISLGAAANRGLAILPNASRTVQRALGSRLVSAKIDVYRPYASLLHGTRTRSSTANYRQDRIDRKSIIIEVKMAGAYSWEAQQFITKMHLVLCSLALPARGLEAAQSILKTVNTPNRAFNIKVWRTGKLKL